MSRVLKYTLRTLKYALRTFVFLGTLGVGAGLAAVVAGAFIIYEKLEELPSYDHLTTYDPAVMSRVHAADGGVIAEYAREQRLFVPIETIPALVRNSFLAVEDHRFYDHIGIDPLGIARAVVVNVRNYGTGKRLVGASTITQQVAKNFLLSSEVSFDRKIKEAVLAYRLEQNLSKEDILELYLNGIYLGAGTYGVAAASLRYFDKPLFELTIDEAAFLAALPRSPSNYDPVRYPKRALERRNWVLKRALAVKFITQQQYDLAVAKPLKVVMRPFGIQDTSDAYFAEEVRRRIVNRYDASRLYSGGLSIRSTLDPHMQKIAQWALRTNIAKFEQSKGYRGDLSQVPDGENPRKHLLKVEIPADLAPWRVALITEVNSDGAKILLRLDEHPDSSGQPSMIEGIIHRGDLTWAIVPDPDWIARRVEKLELEIRRELIAEGVNLDDPSNIPQRPLLPEESITTLPEDADPRQVVSVGDVIIVRPPDEFDPLSEKIPANWVLAQLPELQGAMMALHPHTGRVAAMVGGFSFDSSSFNRAVQARRQPGSAIKPFVYLSALSNGLTPSTVLNDSPLIIDQGDDWGYWRPKNYSGKFLGEGTLRMGIEHSRNVMTVRLIQKVGTKQFLQTAHKFGLGDKWRPIPSVALGAGEASLSELISAYGMIANGGKKITTTLIDQVQDKHGKTIFRADQRSCQQCLVEDYNDQSLPMLEDVRSEVVDSASAYQMTSMLEGVVQRGTGKKLKTLGIPVAGKTGTTNEEKDSWFIGYTPDLVVGAYFGYDTPRPMGAGATGGGLAAPAVRDFMSNALKDTAGVPFRIPDGVRFFRIKADTGEIAQPSDTNVILEAFKATERPPTQRNIAGIDSTTDTENFRLTTSTLSVQQDVLTTDESDQNIQLAPGGLY